MLTLSGHFDIVSFPFLYVSQCPKAERDAYKKNQYDALDVTCLMLATMSPDLQKHHEEMDALDMIKHLKQLHQGQARQERFDVSKALFGCKMDDGTPVGTLVLKMIGYGKKKAKGKFKPKVNDNKAAGKSKRIVATLKPKGGMTKEGSCFHCGETDHWKRNCKVYLEELKKEKKGSETSTSGLKRSRTLAKGDMDLRFGNGARVAALTILLGVKMGMIQGQQKPTKHTQGLLWTKPTPGNAMGAAAWRQKRKESPLIILLEGATMLGGCSLTQKRSHKLLRNKILLKKHSHCVVAMFKSLRILLAIAAFYDYEIWQMDVKTTFLNGLHEDVYMTQPECFVTPQNAGKVCKLQRSINGLKQASRSWNLCFNDAVKEFSFIKNKDEPCVYKKVSGSTIVFLVLYVYDIRLIGNDIPTLKSVKTWLGKCFFMKDLGEANYVLGVKIYRDRSRRLLGLSQSTYIDKVLKRFSMQDSKKGFTPMTHGITLSKEQCPVTQKERERITQIPYASAIDLSCMPCYVLALMFHMP
ncbi:Zinc finger, CCHC-type [Corchorus capsularis]|uniref:Zinc finger, CCHC-type n=1 Tax=Corchorus capsularis TaxID=210143 RepID=A0A1R3GST9_COCAP|nr:Zinc finger, CCHC-type [Corchorus capsularis]